MDWTTVTPFASGGPSEGQSLFRVRWRLAQLGPIGKGPGNPAGNTDLEVSVISPNSKLWTTLCWLMT